MSYLHLNGQGAAINGAIIHVTHKPFMEMSIRMVRIAPKIGPRMCLVRSKGYRSSELALSNADSSLVGHAPLFIDAGI